jgi:hypothetical protein
MAAYQNAVDRTGGGFEAFKSEGKSKGKRRKNTAKIDQNTRD